MSKKKQPKEAVGLDIGSGYMSICHFDGNKCRPIESPMDGSQVPTIVYEDKKEKTWFVGAEALLRSHQTKEDSLYMHAKRSMFERADEKLYGDGNYTPINVTAEIVKFGIKLLLKSCPHIADYPQFGGKRASEDDLVIIFTIPANWSIQQQTHYGRAINQAGLQKFDGFISEPIAASRRCSRLGSLHLADNDLIQVFDLGAGTHDIALLEYDKGVFHQQSAASGNPYSAGHDYTNTIAKDIAKKNGVSWQNVFDKGGLNLSKVAAKKQARGICLLGRG